MRLLPLGEDAEDSHAVDAAAQDLTQLAAFPAQKLPVSEYEANQVHLTLTSGSKADVWALYWLM